MRKIKKQMMNYVKFLICSLFIIFSVPLKAEIVLLKNGDTLSGRVIGQTTTEIKLRMKKGTKRIKKRNIVKIQYVSFTAAQKRAQRAKYQRRVQAWQERRRKIKEQKLAQSEHARQERELDSQIKQEKLIQARQQADRATALRDLVADNKFENDVDEPISYWDFAWRSLVLPGWGHFYLDRPVVGSIYIASTVALLGNIYNSRRIASSAVSQNHKQVEINWLLSLQPNLVTLELRTLYTYNSNLQAAISMQKKVDNYNNSLYTFGVFYGIQLLHIIYNGIAWENGLLIVEKRKDLIPKPDTIHPVLKVATEMSANGKIGTTAIIGVTYVF